jgi:DNA modification methylase
VKPYSKNPRQISEKRLARLRDTLERLGDLSGIVHNLTTDEIIGGHQRMRIFEGASEIIISEEYSEPDDQGTVGTGYILWKGKKYIYRQVRWNSKTAAEANIAANLGAGEWDWDKIANEWDASDLKSWGMDFDELRTWKHDLSGLSEMLKSSEEEPVDAEPQIDKAEELNKIWQVNTGDLWKIGEHRLLCGDSTKREDVERVMGGEIPILMVTDPPYGVDYDANWRNEMDRANGKPYGAFAVGLVTNDTRIDWTEAYSLFSGDICYVWHCGRSAKQVSQNIEDAGFDIIAQIIWVKNNIVIGRGDYHYKHEPCWYAVRKGKNHNWQGSRTEASVWEIDKPMKSETGHSTQKPIECMAKPIENNTALGELVYDPFLGSGTTMVACQNLSRKCRGIEISPNYCAVVLQRMQDAFHRIEIKRENGGKMKRKATGKK